MKTFKHGGGPGDAIYGLATMKYLGGGLLHLNFDGVRQFDQRLFIKQNYIKEIKNHIIRPNEKWLEFPVDYDLDLFRQQPFYEYTLVECHAMGLGVKFDYTKPWISNIDRKRTSTIVINDTGKLRWPGITIDWDQLKGFEEHCVFTGFEHEYNTFVKNRGLKVKYYKIKDAYEWAQVILGSKLYIGNQSSGLAIAEGLKVPRVADLWEGGSKQYPLGEHGYYKLTKDIIRRYLNE